MGTPFLGEIKIISFNFAPKGWALCNGQLLPINQNQALFAIIGTMYGGNGQTTFALPDLRSRVPIHMGNGHILGERQGQETHTITIGEMPAHIHQINAFSGNASAIGPGVAAAQVLATSPTGIKEYSSAAPDNAMNGSSLSSTGSSQPHENRQPYLTLNFIIALQGIFPSQN